jgi:hypothetical protein
LRVVVIASSRHCEARRAEAIPLKAFAAGSASPPCLHNVGYGRPAAQAFAVNLFAYELALWRETSMPVIAKPAGLKQSGW